MAATRAVEECALIIRVETGSSGASTTYGNRTFNNVRPSVTDANVLTVGSSIATLTSDVLNKVMRRDTATLVDE